MTGSAPALNVPSAMPLLTRSRLREKISSFAQFRGLGDLVDGRGAEPLGEEELLGRIDDAFLAHLLVPFTAIDDAHAVLIPFCGDLVKLY
ncbi:MAG: hypothetical protein ABFD52_01635 [Acidobacteriota bacterium]